tara:strand:+ start:1429 stop:1764 length:336 start_codon:yes stop_codon:yes gene_type:complete
MVKIILEAARNGVIKKVVDDNYGGGNETFTTTNVYELTEENEYGGNTYIKRFFFDLCDDLGLSLGSKFDKDVLDINARWGSHYDPTAKDIAARIKKLKTELNELEEWKKNI